jgi:hypothetical protein
MAPILTSSALNSNNPPDQCHMSAQRKSTTCIPERKKDMAKRAHSHGKHMESAGLFDLIYGTHQAQENQGPQEQVATHAIAKMPVFSGTDSKAEALAKFSPHEIRKEAAQESATEQCCLTSDYQEHEVPLAREEPLLYPGAAPKAEALAKNLQQEQGDVKPKATDPGIDQPTEEPQEQDLPHILLVNLAFVLPIVN